MVNFQQVCKKTEDKKSPLEAESLRSKDGQRITSLNRKRPSTDCYTAIYSNGPDEQRP